MLPFALSRELRTFYSRTLLEGTYRASMWAYVFTRNNVEGLRVYVVRVDELRGLKKCAEFGCAWVACPF